MTFVKRATLFIRTFVLISLFFPVSLVAQAQAPISEYGQSLLDDVNQRIHNISTSELQDMLDENDQLYVIDVRTAEEIVLRGGTIKSPNAFNIPRSWVEFRVEDRIPDKNAPIVVYCGVNLRSPLAAETLMKMGYKNVSNYEDGFFAWKQNGLPILSHDKALDSALYSLPQKVADGVWSSIGATLPPTYANAGHNNNLSFIITDEGVVLINAGENHYLAMAQHAEIKKITDKPVKYLIWENGQGHAAGGSKYWKQQGVHIIAHEDARQEFVANRDRIIERMSLRRDKMSHTELVLPDETFSDKKVLQLGGKQIEIMSLGLAHSPGDTQVWLPQQKVMIAGDIAFHERMPAIFEHSDTAGWIETWDKLEAFQPTIVIPGHGRPTDIAEVRKYTRDYLVYLRGEVEKLLDEGKTLEEAANIDQRAYSQLNTYHELHRLNANIVYRAMEFE